MNWMLMPLKRFADFQGRSRRTEYWMFFLFNILVGIVTGIIDAVLGLALMGTNTIASLVLLVPGIGVAVRRLHDTDRTGWWLLAGIVPLIGFFVAAGGAFVAAFSGGAVSPGDFSGGVALVALFGVATLVTAIMLFVFMCLPGTQGPNRFGSDPKGATGDLGDVFR